MLWAAGALDVFATPIQMKKNRPGVMLSVLCRAADCETLAGVLFRETTTLGVRRHQVLRQKLEPQAGAGANALGTRRRHAGMAGAG